MKEAQSVEVSVPSGVVVTVRGTSIIAKGPKGEVTRNFLLPKLKITSENGKVVLHIERGTKREKTMLGTYQAHLRNMVKGVVEPHIYKLKVCSGHFPMTVTVSGLEFVIKNFLGEAVPRRVKLLAGSDVKITGADITVSSPDIDVAAQNAAKIESLCRITNRDRRIFQDGCYITEKAE